MDQLSEFLKAWTARRVIVGTLVVLSVMFVAYVMVSFYQVLVVVFIAFILSTAIRPLVAFFQRFKIRPELGVIIAYVLLLFVLIGILALLTPLITKQIAAISAKIPEYYTDARNYLLDSPSNVIRNITARLPKDPPFALFSSKPTVSDDAQITASVNQLFLTLRNVGVTLFVVIATLLLGFYWTLSGDRIIRSFIQILPDEKRENARSLVAEIQQKIGAFIRGQIILDVSIGVMATIAYFLIGLEYALVLGILAGLLETIPILGPILGAVPPLLITLAQGSNDKFIWVIVASVLIQQVEGTFLVPRVMDRAVGVNAVVTLVAFTAFSAALGIAGGILAVPLAAIVQILFNRLVFSQENAAAGITGRDRFAVLNYKTQELLQSVQRQLRVADSEEDDEVDAFEDQLEQVALDLNSLISTISESEART